MPPIIPKAVSQPVSGLWTWVTKYWVFVAVVIILFFLLFRWKKTKETISRVKDKVVDNLRAAEEVDTTTVSQPPVTNVPVDLLNSEETVIYEGANMYGAETANPNQQTTTYIPTTIIPSAQTAVAAA